MANEYMEEILSEESFTALVSPWRKVVPKENKPEKKEDSGSDDVPTASREEYMGVPVFRVIIITLSEFRRKDPRRFHYMELDKSKIAGLCLIIRGAVERYLLLQENMFVQRVSREDRDIERLLEPHYDSLVKKALTGRTFEMKIELVRESCYFVDVNKDGVTMESRELVRLEDVLWARNMQCINVVVQLIVMMMHMAGVELDSVPQNVLEQIIEDLQSSLQQDRFPKVALGVETLAKASERGCCNLELGTCIYLILFELYYNGTIYNVIVTKNMLMNQWLSLGTALKVLGTMVGASATGGYALAAEIGLALQTPNNLKEKLAMFLKTNCILAEKTKMYCGIEEETPKEEEMAKDEATAKIDTLKEDEATAMSETTIDEATPMSVETVTIKEITGKIEELTTKSEEMAMN